MQSHTHLLVMKDKTRYNFIFLEQQMFHMKNKIEKLTSHMGGKCSEYENKQVNRPAIKTGCHYFINSALMVSFALSEMLRQ